MSFEVQTMWVKVVRRGTVAGVVITRSCCADKAAMKATDIAFPERQEREVFDFDVTSLPPWLLIPDRHRDRLLGEVETAEVNYLLAQQQTRNPTFQ